MTCSALIQEWYSLDQDPKSRAYIQSLLDSGQTSQLETLLGSRLAFGTAGLRSEMGPGFSRLNPVTVALAGQGFLEYLLTKKPSSSQPAESKSELSIVIGYDHRHSSYLFASILAAIFRSENLTVYLFSTVVPTPLLAYSVKKLQTCMGLMVTASHNPRQDNGIKVYQGPQGCQICSPVDVEIATCMNAQKHILPGLNLMLPSVIGTKDPLKAMQQSYYDALYDRVFFSSSHTQQTPLAVYTPMHGVGQAYVDGLMARFSLPPLLSVPSQSKPNPDFPTVTYPNPEEKGAFDDAIQVANQHSNIKYILSNDPDADRFSIAQKLESGAWRIFKGDEIGIILAYFLADKLATRPHCDTGGNGQDGPMLFMNTVVSSPLIKLIAERHDALYRQTLTGFKYLADELLSLRKQHPNLRPILAYEEALGYMISDTVLDKDGISALVVMYQLVLELEEKGIGLGSYLESVYKDVGYAASNNSYFRATHSQQIPSAFFVLRHGRLPVSDQDDVLLKPTCKTYTGATNLPSHLTKGLPAGIQLTRVQDEHPAKMIAYTFSNGLVLTLRASGTEPKLKFYAQWVASEAELQKLPKLVDAILEALLQTKALGLVKA